MAMCPHCGCEEITSISPASDDHPSEARPVPDQHCAGCGRLLHADDLVVDPRLESALRRVRRIPLRQSAEWLGWCIGLYLIASLVVGGSLWATGYEEAAKWVLMPLFLLGRLVLRVVMSGLFR